MYEPNDQGLYSVEVDDLKRIRTALERRVIEKRLVVKYDELPSLRPVVDFQDIKEAGATHTTGSWELHIINHLISHCNLGALEEIDEEIPTETGGFVEDKPVPVAKSKREKRRRKQGETQDAGNVFFQCCNDIAC